MNHNAYIKYTWGRYGNGYEVSSRGDARFSAFNAKLEDGRSIEQHYQCDVKGYDPGGTDWRKGKGKRALYPGQDATLWEAYLGLWKRWARVNAMLIEELRSAVWARGHCRELSTTNTAYCILTDMFAHGPINQAHALAEILQHGWE